MPAPIVPLPQSGPWFETQNPIRVLILGSTGSIGCSALELIARFPDRFKVFALVAGSNAGKLRQQAVQFSPQYVALTQSETVQEKFPCEVLFGDEAVQDLAAHPDVDLVLAAVVGIAGLKSVLAALRAGKRVALANKESLVCAGALISKLVGQGNGIIMPVDSEHSALWQAMQGERIEDIEKLILTASGGPFLNLPQEKFVSVTAQQAISHPRWNMGAKISVDSATLMNKALELIEAHFLFGFEQRQIEVLVHPQSIVHSLLAFKDGSQLAQLSLPDMKAPIGYALNYPQGRLDALVGKLNLGQTEKLEFMPLDQTKFPAVSLARRALDANGAMPAVLSIANEIAVSRFLKGMLTFDRLVPMVEQVCSRYSGACYTSLQDLLDLEIDIKKSFN